MNDAVKASGVPFLDGWYAGRPLLEGAQTLAMNALRTRLVFVTVVAAVLAGVPLNVRAALVSTYAGSGRSGTADGRSVDASFILPVGVGWDSKNDLYVSDAAAQRIRVVSPDGTTRTLAGSGEPARTGLWVRGGYADGRGPAARFNMPMGLAVGPHDEIYVADRRNHCIRLVTAGGDVTTYAGDPNHPGSRDGSRADATFSDPVAVAADLRGDVYVADVVGGLRRIAPDGAVSTLPLPFKAPLGVAYAGPGVSVLWISNADGLWRVDLDASMNSVTRVALYRTGLPRYPPPAAEPGVLTLVPAGQSMLGYPFAIAAIDPESIVFTDVVTHSIRYFDASSQDLQVVGGRAIEDAAANGGGLQNGRSEESRFDAPMGIAARADGVIAVADSGNRCIRLIRAIDRSHAFFPQNGLLPDFHVRTGDYRIALVGSSSVWGSGTFDASVGGQLEGALDAAPPFAGNGRKARVLTVKMGPDMAALRAYVTFLVEAKQVDAVVVLLNDFFLTSSYGVGVNEVVSGELGAGAWQERLSTDLASTARALRAENVPVLFVASPLPTELGLDELTLPKLLGFSRADSAADGRVEAIATAPFVRAGVSWLNGWTVFDDDARSVPHAPLFLSLDGHFTPYGNAVLGRAIAERLLRDHPWSGR